MSNQLYKPNGKRLEDIGQVNKASEIYSKHIHAMTSELLHSKSDIAAELAWRDYRIAALKEQLEEIESEARVMCEWLDC
jgi:hypothetical protein